MSAKRILMKICRVLPQNNGGIMKILFVSELYPEKGRESYCIFLEQQAKALIEKGNAVDTLKVEQNGKISTSTINSASRLAGSTTRGSSTKSVSGGQCAARTKKGSRCSRKAAAGSIYCWQHNK